MLVDHGLGLETTRGQFKLVFVSVIVVLVSMVSVSVLVLDCRSGLSLDRDRDRICTWSKKHLLNRTVTSIPLAVKLRQLENAYPRPHLAGDFDQ